MKEKNQKMGTHKFRFSDIMPHSWLYKLKGISRSSSSSRKHFSSSPKHLSSSSPDASSSRKIRLSSSSPVHLPQASPSKSSFKRRIKRKTVYKPASRVKLFSSSPNSHVSLTPSRNHRSKSSTANAIIVEQSDDAVRVSSPSEQSYGSPCDPEPYCSTNIEDDYSLKKLDDVSQDPSAHSSPVLVETVKEPSFEMITQQKLKNTNADSSILASSSPVPVETVKEPSFEMITQQKMKKPSPDSSILASLSPALVETVREPQPFEMGTQQKLKRPNAGSSGIKIRANSTKIARKKTKKGRTSPESKKTGIAKSFAIVLTSVDPEKDFKESMVEMIVENKIKEQKDLEDLLACYLSLNSSEYHDIIIKAFEKTWFHLTHLT